MDIYDYAKYPTSEEWLMICGDKVKTLEKICLGNSKRKFNILDFDEGYHGMKLSYWLQEFNNRAFDLITNYTLLKSYYDAGIPDDEWYKSPGDNGQIAQYFPHFGEEHFGNLYWFGFYTDSYYTRFEGLIDAVYHVINKKYKFNFEPSLRFRKKVIEKLETVDKDLFDYLEALPTNAVFQKVKNFRNNIVHNYRPNQIEAGFNKVKKSDGSETMTLSIGNYTTSTEFLSNIHDSLDLLAEITDTIRGKVEVNVNE